MLDICFILKKYQRVFVISNATSEETIDRLNLRNTDLIVIFNKSIFSIDKLKGKNVLWFHRYDDIIENYFGEGFTIHSEFMHGSISNQPCTIPSWSQIHLLSNSMPGIDQYPIGKKLFNFKRRKKDRHIIAPSTGFIAISYILQALELHDVETYAIGFGKFPNGWHGHDWQFERQAMAAQNKIKLLNDNLKTDYLIHLRKIYPNSFF